MNKENARGRSAEERQTGIEQIYCAVVEQKRPHDKKFRFIVEQIPFTTRLVYSLRRGQREYQTTRRLTQAEKLRIRGYKRIGDKSRSERDSPPKLAFTEICIS